MPLLFIFFIVIIIIMIIARLASKTRPESERAPESENGFYTIKKIETEAKDNVIEALMRLLVKKELVTEAEIFSELQSIIDEKKQTKAKIKTASSGAKD